MDSRVSGWMALVSMFKTLLHERSLLEASLRNPFLQGSEATPPPSKILSYITLQCPPRTNASTESTPEALKRLRQLRSKFRPSLQHLLGPAHDPNVLPHTAFPPLRSRWSAVTLPGWPLLGLANCCNPRASGKQKGKQKKGFRVALEGWVVVNGFRMKRLCELVHSECKRASRFAGSIAERDG